MMFLGSLLALVLSSDEERGLRFTFRERDRARAL
jgi:hypothetical protein